MITRLYRFKQKISKKQFIDVHITDHCNLNCKGCGHFSSISQPYGMSLEEMEIACKKLKPILHKFSNSIHLMGGEPLLHPEVEGIMSLVRNYFPETEIQLIPFCRYCNMEKEHYEEWEKSNRKLEEWT